MAKKKGISYTQRTLQELKKRGIKCGIVERWLRYAGPHGVRQDLFGFIDIVALCPVRNRIVGIQSTGPSGHSAHRKKIVIEHNQDAYDWLSCYGLIELWSWHKYKVERGGLARKWGVRIEEITLEDLDK